MSQPTPDFRTVVYSEESPRSPRYDFKFIGFVCFLVIILALVKYADFVEETPDGTPQLRPERQQKVEQRLTELNGAVQYALKAIKQGVYPCFYCESGTIELLPNEVWKYGYTTKKYRYSALWLSDNQLLFDVQFVGSVSDCMKQEQLKILNYPLLPENQKRIFKLPRPPGNKVDN